MPQPVISLLPNVFGHDYTAIEASTWQHLRDGGISSLELGATSEPFPARLIDRLRSHGFAFLGQGSSLWVLQQHLSRFIAEARDRRETHLLCYWPWLDGAEQVTRGQVSATARSLQDLGRRCRESGLTFAFHNHGVEFQLLDGLTICEHLLNETDPEAVSLELDLYHACKVGYDPLPLVTLHRDRIKILHLNAMDGCGDGSIVGDGIPGFESLLRTLPAAHWVIEGHKQKNPLRYVQESHRRLQSLALHLFRQTPLENRNPLT